MYQLPKVLKVALIKKMKSHATYISYTGLYSSKNLAEMFSFSEKT